MKVILLEDIDTLGKMGDTISVKNGYARNYLIPRNLALQATAKNLKAQKNKFKDIEVRVSKIVDDAQSLADKVAGVSLIFTRKTGEKGRLFGSVTNMDIADALAEKGLTVDRKDIILPEPIKSLGEFDVQVKLHHDVTPVLKITVLPEEGEIPEAAMEQTPAQEPGPEPAAEFYSESVEGPEPEPVPSHADGVVEEEAPEAPEETPVEEVAVPESVEEETLAEEEKE